MSAALIIAVLLLAAVLLAIAALALFTAHTARRVDAALPPAGRFIEVGGARIHYVEQGSGPALLMIHGLGGHARTFTHSLVERLARDYRVVVMERPGSGHSTRAPGASAGPLAQARTVAELIRALGLDRPLLVGHSLGGAVALATALEHPELVRGLALVAPLTHVEQAPPAVFAPYAIRSPLVRSLVAWTVATPGTILRGRQALDALFGPDAVPRDYAIAGGGLMGLRPRGFVGTSTDLLAVNHDMPALVERYGSLRVPVGVLYGTGDRILSHQVHGEGMKSRVPACRVELMEGGHMIPLTAPDRVAAFVRAVDADTAAPRESSLAVTS
jgi:pimeloyl-ACP methyl ester carboxylesterase